LTGKIEETQHWERWGPKHPEPNSICQPAATKPSRTITEARGPFLISTPSAASGSINNHFPRLRARKLVDWVHPSADADPAQVSKAWPACTQASGALGCASSAAINRPISGLSSYCLHLHNSPHPPAARACGGSPRCSRGDPLGPF
jgi:hypothetical protein